MTYKLGRRSLRKLEGVHPDLVSVVHRAIKLTDQDFTVLEGVRSLKRQRQLFTTGKSKTMNSRHLTGHAVDLAPYPINWKWELFFPIADAMIEASQELDIPLRWGGNWHVHDLHKWKQDAKTLRNQYRGDFPDGPHFELPWKYYGKQD